MGGFSVHTIALDDVSRRRAIEVLEVIDRAIEQGTLAARPAEGACGRCDFVASVAPMKSGERAGSQRASSPTWTPCGGFHDTVESAN